MSRTIVIMYIHDCPIHDLANGPRTWRVGRTEFVTGGSAARGGAAAARVTARKRAPA